MSIEKNSLPRHIGLITDGNRRWAKNHGLPSLEGHRQGFEAAKKVFRTAYERGIKEFTAWAFSTENWNRSAEEIDYLMKLFETWLKHLSDDYAKKGVRIRVFGQIERVPDSLQRAAAAAVEKTAQNSAATFNLALSYGGRDEIVQGIKKIAAAGIKPEDITEQTVSKNLWLPDADLIIRTGGEKRLSGFMAWQSVYAELFFIDKYLPDFMPQDLDKILAEYAQRNRRFGK
ncbi:MAG: polyprenyl diphosphate synthase [Candidatus Pacebacteria bacterium]|jgi:undecaprenyl diphosphate synthase|nr:polyprenyl diphosphate synthase [Candidatus Paceibacterota bacterium]